MCMCRYSGADLKIFFEGDSGSSKRQVRDNVYTDKQTKPLRGVKRPNPPRSASGPYIRVGLCVCMRVYMYSI